MYLLFEKNWNIRNILFVVFIDFLFLYIKQEWWCLEETCIMQENVHFDFLFVMSYQYNYNDGLTLI